MTDHLSTARALLERARTNPPVDVGKESILYAIVALGLLELHRIETTPHDFAGPGTSPGEIAYCIVCGRPAADWLHKRPEGT